MRERKTRPGGRRQAGSVAARQGHANRACMGSLPEAPDWHHIMCNGVPTTPGSHHIMCNRPLAAGPICPDPAEALARPSPQLRPPAAPTFPPAGGLAWRALCVGLHHLAVHVVHTRPGALCVQRGDAHGAAAVGDEVDGRPAKLVGRLAHHPGKACGLEELVHPLMLHQRPVAGEVWQEVR